MKLVENKSCFILANKKLQSWLVEQSYNCVCNISRILFLPSYTVPGSIFIKPGCFYQNLVDVKLMQSPAWGRVRLVKLHLMFGGGKYRYVVVVVVVVVGY